MLIVTLVNSAVDNFARPWMDSCRNAACCRTSATACGRCTGWPTTSCGNGPIWWGWRTTSASWTSATRTRILQEAAEAWIAAHPDAADQWLNPDLDERKRDWVRRDHWPKLVATLGGNFIRLAKDLELTPALLRERIDRLSGLSPEEA